MTREKRQGLGSGREWSAIGSPPGNGLCVHGLRTARPWVWGLTAAFRAHISHQARAGVAGARDSHLRTAAPFHPGGRRQRIPGRCLVCTPPDGAQGDCQRSDAGGTGDGHQGSMARALTRRDSRQGADEQPPTARRVR